MSKPLNKFKLSERKYQIIYIYLIAQSTGAVKYTDCFRPSGFWPCVKSCLVGGSDKYNTPTAYLQKGETPLIKRVLDRTLNNLMIRFQ